MPKYQEVIPPATAMERTPTQLRPLDGDRWIPRQPSIHSDAGVPFAVAMAGGMLCILWLLSAMFLFMSHATLYLRVPLFGGATVALVLFVAERGAWKQTLWTVERVVNVDLTGDKQIGPPETYPVFINPNQGQHNARTEAEKAYRRDLATFVWECQETGDTSGPMWEPRLGREKYVRFRNALITSGWAVWKDDVNHKLGWRLTADAQEIMDKIFAPTHPTDDDGE